ncbi:MAG: NAD(P)H-dependent oxidoreductase subunit E [Thermoanaerobaculales bacterium]|nr:NAD(P)H-dependent oxidoreductase subunit E [Thermoanaerobaculales bacterium]
MSQDQTPPLTVASHDEVKEIHFDGEMEDRIKNILGRYSETQAALLPVLWACQERWGWISAGIMEAIAERLALSPAFVESVVTFYTMFRSRPPGRFHLQVCTTLSCRLCGAGPVIDELKRTLGIDFGETTPDGRFTLSDVKCLGVCGEGPVIQINDDYYTRLNTEELGRLLDEFK